MAVDVLVSDVVVVGAGPVGLMLAGELRLGGADVVVLDEREGPTTQSRASTLHARTMEIFEARGLLGALGTPPCQARGHFGGAPLDLTLPGRFPGQWKVPQTRTEQLLGDWAKGLGARLRRRHTVRAVRAGEKGVEVVAAGPGGPVRVRARYLAACDGERSTVRRLLGAAFPGQDAGRELLRADVAGLDIAERRFERLPAGLAIAARRADGVTRVMVHEFGVRAQPRTGEPEFAEVCQVWKRVTGQDISGGQPRWVNSFGDACRLLEHYRHGRVLFAGDAAHQQMPVGGQALNLGLQDAVNLGWKLAAVARGRAPEALLDSYHGERHAVGRRVLDNIRTQAQLLLGGAESACLRTLLGELLPKEDVRRHLAAMISGLDVRYDMGAAPATHPLLGARLPYARLSSGQKTLDSADLWRDGRGVLLALGPRAEGLRAVAAPWQGRVTWVAAHCADAEEPGPLHGLDALLVRPDGHIAWLRPDQDQSPDQDQGRDQDRDQGRGRDQGREVALRAALARWFGSPSARRPAPPAPSAPLPVTSPAFGE
ncbi:FAD-dependent monooxygenase [Streptomyces sp. NPDC093510]|uniref:FAD-dependent monooxygenase n=1 Tax=Streptomyces sp. NPDC093510 TaxID=3155199 RepID=UPI0034429EAF